MYCIAVLSMSVKILSKTYLATKHLQPLITPAQKWRRRRKKKSTSEQFSCIIYIFYTLTLLNSQVTDKRWHWSKWNLLCISLFDERYPEFPWLFTVPVYQLTIHTRKAIVDEDGLPMAKTPEIEADHALVVWPWKLLIGWYNLQRKRGKTECEWKKKKTTDMMRRKRD